VTPRKLPPGSVVGPKVRLPGGSAKRSKYGAKRTTVDGVTFASKREAKRYGELKALQDAGVISRLELQPAFPLVVAEVVVGVYKADFAYVENGRRVIEDVKGVRTPVYRLKKRIVEAYHKVTIREV
jgi:hypothetical protein